MTRARVGLLAGVAAATLALSGCETTTAPPSPEPVVDHTPDDRITITDADGKVWDITHAVRRYGFDPRGFQFGIGVGVIEPIFDPEFVGPGEPGYPDAALDISILGFDPGGDPRAYSISVLSRHEVVNDAFGDAHLAVAY